MPQPAFQADDPGIALTHAAWQFLAEELAELGTPLPQSGVIPLRKFVADARADAVFTEEQKRTVVAQTRILFEHLYPHMPFKLELFNLPSPIEILAGVEKRLHKLKPIEFHQEMIRVFSFVRDAHTLYGAPPPLRGAVAFLPFQVRYLGEGDSNHFFVTSVMKTAKDQNFGDTDFGPGVEIVGWGALSMVDYIGNLLQHLPGGNLDAAFNRAARAAAIRPLTFCELPSKDEIEHGVCIRYRLPDSEETREIRLAWGVIATDGGVVFPSSAFSISPVSGVVSAFDRCLHYRDDIRHGQTLDPNDRSLVSSVPEMFKFQHTGGKNERTPIYIGNLVDPNRPNARFGYLKIAQFGDDALFSDRAAILAEFARILTLLEEVAPDGLVLDLRGNPGGDVLLAEHMLQMLTPRRVRPLSFHFANTPAMRRAFERVRKLSELPSDRLSFEDGEKLGQARRELERWWNTRPDAEFQQRLTEGVPLTDPASIASVDQVYHGAIVLLVNSFTYSAGDMFAAGFQDHGIGPVISCDLSTGGGGADVWNYSEAIGNLGPDPGLELEDLPEGVTVRFAARRCSRRSKFGVIAIEDFGVGADVVQECLRAEEVVNGYPKLLQRACIELGRRPVYRLTVHVFDVLDDGGVNLDLATQNIDKLRFSIDRVTVLQTFVPLGGADQFALPPAPDNFSPSTLRIEGLEDVGDREPIVRAVRRVVLREPAPPAEFDSLLQGDIDPITGQPRQ